MDEEWTNQSGQVQHAQSVANVIADDDHVRLEEPPVFWAGGVVELEAVVGCPGFQLEDEGLVEVA